MKFWPLNLNLFNVSIWSIIFIRQDVGGLFSRHLFRACLQACFPSSCGIFVYNELTSRVSRIHSWGGEGPGW